MGLKRLDVGGVRRYSFLHAQYSKKHGRSCRQPVQRRRRICKLSPM